MYYSRLEFCCLRQRSCSRVLGKEAVTSERPISRTRVCVIYFRLV